MATTTIKDSCRQSDSKKQTENSLVKIHVAATPWLCKPGSVRSVGGWVTVGVGVGVV